MKFEMAAEVRDRTGKGAARQLRRSGRIPAVPREWAIEQWRGERCFAQERLQACTESIAERVAVFSEEPTGGQY